jgi:hypothetical protein
MRGSKRGSKRGKEVVLVMERDTEFNSWHGSVLFLLKNMFLYF